MLEKDSEWILPENLKKQETIDRKKINGGSFEVGDFGSYYAYRKGINSDIIKSHAISDDKIAFNYARSLRYFLLSHGCGELKGNILDIGCAIGTITNAIHHFNKNGNTYGLDISEDAVAFAREKYPLCRFYNQSATKLNNFEDDFFDIIHAREFYPFTRTNDDEYQLEYLRLFYQKLKKNGLIILQMVAKEKGFCNRFKDMKKEITGIGYTDIIRKTTVPIKVVSLFGDSLSNRIIYNAVNYFSDVIKGRDIGYFYALKK